MRSLKTFMREEGSFPVLALIMVGFLVFTGLAYMKWGADESRDAMFNRHRMQAYYAAHAGIMDLAFKDLRSLEPAFIPREPEHLGTTTLFNASGQSVGEADVWRDPDINQSGTAFADFNYMDFRGYGRVKFRDYEGNEAYIRDTVSVKVKILGLSHYFYLTDQEETPFGEVIKFWHEDTLEGWVHSNDTIAIMENPVFYNRVTTCAPVFWEGIGYNPQFVNYDPTFNYREVYLPTEATEIRAAATAAGNFWDSDNGYWAHRLTFNSRNGYTMFKWPFGLPFDSLAPYVQYFNRPVPTWEAIYVDGYLELSGVVAGQVTVGATGHPNTSDDFLGKHCIRLLDDIRYWFADPNTGEFNDTATQNTDILGIVSESNITIANTWANGREHQAQGSNIIITGAMVALGDDAKRNFWGSFSFEDQNEADGGFTTNPTIWEWYTGDYEYGNPNDSDERGDIYLWGAVSQRRRGYVHRSNHNGTGYGKEYHFDDRLTLMAPPYFIKATDSEGNAHFQIISWGDD